VPVHIKYWQFQCTEKMCVNFHKFFPFQQKINGTERRTKVSMMHALHILWYPKKHYLAYWSSKKKYKPIALSIMQVGWKFSPLNKMLVKFCSNNSRMHIFYLANQFYQGDMKVLWGRLVYEKGMVPNMQFYSIQYGRFHINLFLKTTAWCLNGI